MNQFEVGSYIEWLDTPTSRIDVVLWIAPNRSNCVCIDVDRKNKCANPTRWSTADIEAVLACGKARVVPCITADNLPVVKGPRSQDYLNHREKVWKIIEPLVLDLRIFHPKLRGKLISEHAKKTKVSAKMILKYLRQYWQAGQNKAALLPYYANCGGSRKIRRCTDGVKRGRPSEIKVKQGIETGKNADEEVRRKFRKGIALYYENKSGATLYKAFQDTIRWLFNVGVEAIDGVDYPILPPAHERPQFEQFKYWYSRERRLSRSIILREGENEFNLNHRALGGDVTQDAFGPGSIFELDSTIADIYVVSALDRNRMLERPVLYFLKDVFSRLIVGVGATLNGPS
jgi:putative transposase